MHSKSQKSNSSSINKFIRENEKNINKLLILELLQNYVRISDGHCKLVF